MPFQFAVDAASSVTQRAASVLFSSMNSHSMPSSSSSLLPSQDAFSPSVKSSPSGETAYEDLMRRQLQTTGTLTWTPSPDLCEKGGGGIFFPLFGDDEADWDKNLRQLLYTVGLLWCFLGVAIVADIFMGAIEKITSIKKTVKIPNKPGSSPVANMKLHNQQAAGVDGDHKAEDEGDAAAVAVSNGNGAEGETTPSKAHLTRQNTVSRSGEYRVVTVKIWNDTVANLTLMALGSSAPEILLSCIELFDNDFFAGELGPSTIVGSAAFNLFCIVACCVVVIPAGEIRKIRYVSVYAVTAVTSVFAYIWLIVILQMTSENMVRPWEGIVTFLMFPVMVVVAYLADIGVILKGKGNRGKVVAIEDMTKEDMAKAMSDIAAKFGQNRTMDEAEMVRMLQQEHQAPVSRAARRVAATRDVCGGKRVSVSAIDTSKLTPELERSLNSKDKTTTSVRKIDIGFLGCTACSVLESGGSVTMSVSRNDASGRCAISYKTVNGPEGSKGAKAGEDYKHTEGELIFEEGETEKTITVEIIDDEGFEEDEDFYVDLESPRFLGEAPEDAVLRLRPGSERNTVTIIDDDLPGVISFEDELLEVAESSHDEEVHFKVIRRNGSTGKVSVKYRTENDSAIAALDFDAVEGELEFGPGEVDSYITVNIKQRGRYEDKERFRLYIEEPTGGAKLDETTDGGAEQCVLTIEILPGDIKERVQRLGGLVMAMNTDKFSIGNANYKEQFISALYVNGSPEEQKEASRWDWFMHILTVPWKLLFATIPPTDYADGKVCFVGSLLLIGLLTAAVGDLAGLMGCTFELPKSVTAITFVALGTSLPDLFASKKCAEEDPYADASVGNVTGSNSVNVFLGLGLPWMIGSLYWNGRDTQFLADKEWPLLCCKGDMSIVNEYASDPGFVVVAGSLGYSVAIFCGCAVACLFTLHVRRQLYGGELGGPNGPKMATAVFFVMLWLTYVALSAIKAYDDED
jgi:solute carrier family 8 (sodium/calcium exchanger)